MIKNYDFIIYFMINDSRTFVLYTNDKTIILYQLL